MMKLRCAVLDDYQNIASKMADWSKVSEQVEIKFFPDHYENEDDLVHAIMDCHIIVIMRERTSFGALLLSRLPLLKLLITTGMRNASIDLAEAASRGIIVSGTRGHKTPTVELTWALILGLSRNIIHENHSFRSNGAWQSTVGTDLFGKRLGLLGLGEIGSRMARIGLAFGMEVAAWSQNLSLKRTEEIGVKLASSKEELLSSSDFVSIHLVLSERTKGLVGAAELKMMRSSSYLINTSRASIVDQDALVEALQNDWIAGAGIDVFEVEPLPKDDILRTLPSVLATPHLGYVSQTNYKTFYEDAVEDIQAYLSGSPLRMLT